MKELKPNSSNFRPGDLVYGLFCDRIGIVIEVQRINDGYQIINVSTSNGRIVLEHECYWVHMDQEEEYRELAKRKELWLNLVSTSK